MLDQVSTPLTLIPKQPFNLEEALSGLTDELPTQVIEYLTGRYPGYGLSDILKVGNFLYEDSTGRLAIPLINKDKEIVGIKYRVLKDSEDNNFRYTMYPGSQTGFYTIPGKIKELAIVEGELDAITLKLGGFQGEVWALGCTSLKPQRIPELKAFKNVYVIPDNDEPGLEAFRELLMTSLRGAQSVQLPNEVKDLNEYLNKSGKDALESFIKQGLVCRESKLTLRFNDGLSASVEYLKNKSLSQGHTTGYKSLDRKLGGGLRAGELTVINAYAKGGKTTFVNNLCVNLAAHHHKIGIASFEMDPERLLIPSMLSVALETDVRANPELFIKLDFLDNIFFYKHFGQCDWRDVENWAYHMIETEEIKFLVIDHAGFLLADAKDPSLNKALAQNLAQLAKSTGVHILAVVQSPNVDRTKKPYLSLSTAYGGAAWAQNCFNYITIENHSEEADVRELRLLGSRYPGSRCSEEPILLVYDHETCKLID